MPDKNNFLTLWILILAFGISQAQTTRQPVSLFNGEDLTHWKMFGENPGFEVRDGLIQTTVQNGDNLFTEKVYGNYIFSADYMLSEVGNSGILIRSDPDNAWGTGVEVQLLAPWTPYRDDLHCTASLYGHVPVTNRPDETTGIWHRMEIECDREYIRVSVDGEMATEVEIDTVESLGYMHMEGAVGIQSNHSHASEFAKFKNITIIDLDADPEYVLAGFSHESSRVRAQAYSAATRLGVELVPVLGEMLDSGDPMLEKGSRQVLFDLTARATGADAMEDNLQPLQRSIVELSKNVESVMAVQYLEEMVRMTLGNK